ncbi:hypothetical protein [Pseudarthrobacter oxydans]|uniref:hypothetical protein n=1 Tax=Pseudarthrobacter oxydans TaxID=1671 RepID=UPI0035E8E811|nr:hypothetical protein GCM10017547_31740 [Pseudarthrobacter oxydans]
MLRTILTQLAAFSAVVASVLLANDLKIVADTPWKLILGAIVLLVAAVAAIWEIIGTFRSRPVRYRGDRRDEKILKRMTKILRTQERCVISSNDLSWVKGKARDVLFDKASKRSLTLVMPCANKLSSDLVDKGAVAYYYGDEEFRFASRFTLVNQSRSDAWVAIGHGTKNEHTIRTIDSKDDPAIHLADDLFRLVRRRAMSEPRSE